MTRRRVTLIVSLAVFARALSATTSLAATPQRIVSLVPAVTEMIFAIGDGNRLVGVSSYDRFPREVRRITKVGGLLDPSVEAILALKPDLVIVYSTQAELRQRLDRVGISYHVYHDRTLADITATMRAIGARIGSSARAETLAGEIERAIATIRTSVVTLRRPRTLLVFGHDPASLRNVNATGGYGFLHDMLDAAGGANVFGDIRRESVQTSTETILARQPDVIIDLRYGESVSRADLPREIQVWNGLGSIPAVQNHQVFLLVGDEFVVPGPRVVDAVRRLAETLHPKPR